MNAQTGSLRTRLFVGVAWTAAVALALFTAALLWIMHRHVHRQTDALLLQLARAEAHELAVEGKGAHLHEMAIPLPSFSAAMTERYALIFDDAGSILTATANITTAERAPQSWLPLLAGSADARLFNAEDLAAESLRLAVIPSVAGTGGPIFVGVGVSHRAIDASTWATLGAAIPLSLLAILTIAGSAFYLARRLTRDLADLSRRCNDVDLHAAMVGGAGPQPSFTLSPSAPREAAVLAETLEDLVGRVRELVESQNEFVAEAAHELRTPLTALRGELELALRRERSADEYREAIAAALNDTARLERLAGSLLESARGQQMGARLERLDLAALTGEALRRFAAAMRDKGIETKLEGEGVCCVRADRMAAARVLDNLLQNALAHSGASRLTLRLEDEDADDPRRAALLIADDGAGVPDKLRKRLFLPFQRGSQHEGYGLGLYLAKQLMERQGGDLRYAENLLPNRDGAGWRLSFLKA